MLNEKHHAFVLCCFYRELTDRFGKRGRQAFIKAAQTYGEQRGKRMSLRALRDGNSLDFDSYFAYGEWQPSIGAYDLEMTAGPGVVDERVTRCPWAETFKEEDLLDCGMDYCKEIDRAIVRGFSPDLELELESTLHRQGSCRFLFKDKRITEKTLMGVPNPPRPDAEVVKPFKFHVAHVYFVYAHLVWDVFGIEGRSAVAKARRSIKEKFGKKVIETIMLYRKCDFTRI
ncbi:MAG: L-2-amino-thiazoline-4-carboxylic acid hydrolase [Synergistales bacterium]